MAVALLSFVLVPVKRSTKLRKGHDTEFGVKERRDKQENVLTSNERGNIDAVTSPVEGTGKPE
jgi:hypothetical protein